MVNVGLVVHLDVTLDVGDVKETVEVTAETALIEPDETSISTAVDPRSMQNLPFQDRQFLNLALIVPGTVPGTPGARVALTSVETFTVAGMRNQSNNYTLDGISNNDPHVNAPLNLFRLSDAVQEFNVETSIASAERPEQVEDSAVESWMSGLGRNLGQRSENEHTFVHPWMRQG